jgi:hypothetical protein
MRCNLTDTQEAPAIDPISLKPDLYAAAAANDLEKVVLLLEEEVPATFIDLKTGLTVCMATCISFVMISIVLTVF